MNPILIRHDCEKNETILTNLKKLLPEYQAVITAYNKLGLAKIQNGELELLFADPETFVFDKQIADAPLSLAGLPINKQKAMEIVEKPAGFEDLKDALHNAQLETKQFNEIQSYKIGWPALPCFQMDEKNKLSIKEETLADIKERCSFYATSERAQSVLKFAQAIVKAAEDPEIANMIHHDGDGLVGVIKKIFPDFNSSFKLEQLKISGTKISRYNNPSHR